MILEGWYRDLARINRQISEARQLIERQNALISKLTEPQRDPEKRHCTPRDLNVQGMISHRTNILVFVRTFPLQTAASAPVLRFRTRRGLTGQSNSPPEKEDRRRVGRGPLHLS